MVELQNRTYCKKDMDGWHVTLFVTYDSQNDKNSLQMTDNSRKEWKEWPSNPT